MVTPNDIDAELILEIEGQFLTTEKFLRGIRAFFGILDDVTKNICENEQHICWSVQVESGSNLVCIKPKPGSSTQLVQRITDTVHKGIKSIEDQCEEPEYFSLQAIKQLQDLGNITNTDGGEEISIRVWHKHTPIAITRKTSAHVVELLKEGTKDHGSVEGRLQTISERGGFRFVIYEPVWDKSIICYVDDELFSEVLKNFGKRVEVFGIINYRRDGTPTSIKVERVVPFPKTDDIPDFRSVRGILRKYK